MFSLPRKERQNPPVGAGGASAEFGESPRHLGRRPESSGAGQTEGSCLGRKHLLPAKHYTYLASTLPSSFLCPLNFHRNISSAVPLLCHAWLSYSFRSSLRCREGVVRLAFRQGTFNQLLDCLVCSKDKTDHVYIFTPIFERETHLIPSHS